MPARLCPAVLCWHFIPSRLQQQQPLYYALLYCLRLLCLFPESLLCLQQQHRTIGAAFLDSTRPCSQAWRRHGPITGRPVHPGESKQAINNQGGTQLGGGGLKHGMHLKCRSTMPVLPVLHLMARAMNSAPSLMHAANSSLLDSFPSCSQAHSHLVASLAEQQHPCL